MKPFSTIHQIYFNSAYLGIHLSAIDLPQACFFLGLTRQDQLYLAAADPEVHEQDWLIAIALDPSMLPELEVCLTRTHAVH